MEKYLSEEIADYIEVMKMSSGEIYTLSLGRKGVVPCGPIETDPAIPG